MEPDEPTAIPPQSEPSVSLRRRRCSVCRDPRLQQIHALRASGMKLNEIEDALRAEGRGIKRETLGLHFRICLGGRDPVLPDDLSMRVGDSIANAASDAERDFAVLVRERATELLRAGALKVTASHGIAAQALLDRRAEKAADRDLALNMARLLSGAMSLPPMEVIEGRVIEVPPLDSPLLAPPDIVEPR